MEKLAASADYLRRARRPRQKPSPCAPTGWLDPGGSGRTQWRPRHRGQPDRGRQARSSSLDAATTRQGRRSRAKRSAALTSGPAPLPVRAADGRPFSCRAYFVFSVCRSGTTCPAGLTVITNTSLRLSTPFVLCLLRLKRLQKRHDRIGGCDPHSSHPFTFIIRPWVRPDLTTNGPAPFPVPAAGDRPSTWCLMLLQNLQQRHDLHDRLDCHRKHLPPARQLPGLAPEAGGRE